MSDFAIRKCLEKLGDNGGWYNAQKILPYIDECMMLWIVGERRIGKTDLMLHLAMMLWQDHGLRTMWIRNRKVELDDPAFFNTFLADALEHGWTDREYIVRPDGVYEATEDGKPAPDKRAIVFQSISTFSNRRGGAHPDVVMMVFDEFMPEDRKYPAQCAKGLMSLTKTVFSGRTDARVFCLSNFVSAANPYFVAFGIYPEPGQDVTVYEDKGMLIEKCRGYHRAIAEDNPWTSIYRAGRYGDYADETEDTLLQLVRKMPKGAIPEPYAILRDGRVYRPYTKDGLVYWALYKGSLNGVSLYASTIQETSDSVRMLPRFYLNSMAEISANGGYRFADANVMFAILNIVYETV